MLRDAGAARREVGLRRIFERLSELESSVRDTDEQQMYNKLYRQFLRDPDRLRNPHRPIAKQIEDLVLALSSADFVDLTNPRNQVVTKFIYDAAAATESEERSFGTLDSLMSDSQRFKDADPFNVCCRSCQNSVPFAPLADRQVCHPASSRVFLPCSCVCVSCL